MPIAQIANEGVMSHSGFCTTRTKTTLILETCTERMKAIWILNHRDTFSHLCCEVNCVLRANDVKGL